MGTLLFEGTHESRIMTHLNFLSFFRTPPVSYDVHIPFTQGHLYIHHVRSFVGQILSLSLSHVYLYLSFVQEHDQLNLLSYASVREKINAVEAQVLVGTLFLSKSLLEAAEVCEVWNLNPLTLPFLWLSPCRTEC